MCPLRSAEERVLRGSCVERQYESSVMQTTCKRPTDELRLLSLTDVVQHQRKVKDRRPRYLLQNSARGNTPQLVIAVGVLQLSIELHSLTLY